MSVGVGWAGGWLGVGCLGRLVKILGCVGGVWAGGCSWCGAEVKLELGLTGHVDG